MKKIYLFVLILALIIISIAPAKNCFATTNIPLDAKEFNGNYYYIYDKMVTWQDANKNCIAVGGHLAVITSEEEQAFVTELSGDSTDMYWLGATRKADTFKWVTGEKWGFTSWDLSRPSYYDYWDALILSKEGWVDYFSDNRYKSVAGYICEWEMDDYTTSLPAKASILSVIKASSTTATISWKEIKGVEGYSIYMKTEENGSYRRLSDIKEADITTYMIENLKKGVTYYFRIRAYKTIYGDKTYGDLSVPKKLKVN